MSQFYKINCNLFYNAKYVRIFHLIPSNKYSKKFDIEFCLKEIDHHLL